MPKYFLDNIEGQIIDPGSEITHHLKNVLRTRVGEKIILCDGKENDYLCTVDSLEPFLLRLENMQRCCTEPPCKITLYQALVKSDKFEWIIQKSVELGVHSIVPVLTEYSIRKNTKAERFQKIAESAAGQSMRGIIPQIYPQMPWKDALCSAKGYIIAAHISCSRHSIKQAFEGHIPNEINLWIGPEGGFSKSEVENMKKAGFNFVSLGSRILRAETAAITALAQILMVTEL